MLFRSVVHAPGLLDGVVDGESVAVNGTCLTAAGRPGPDELAFDLMPETLRRSNLGRLVAGDPVNLERSLRFGDRIGGHLVQGHIAGTAGNATPASPAAARTSNSGNGAGTNTNGIACSNSGVTRFENP